MTATTISVMTQITHTLQTALHAAILVGTESAFPPRFSGVLFTLAFRITKDLNELRSASMLSPVTHGIVFTVIAQMLSPNCFSSS